MTQVDDVTAGGGGLLRGRVAVVTGGTRGIGLAIATRFAAQGATVLAVGRSAPEGAAGRRREGNDDDNDDDIVGLGDAGEQGAGDRISRLIGDVGEEADVVRMFAETVERHGGVDILVNNAGSSPGGPIHRTELADFRAAIDVNLQGSWLCTRELLRHVRRVGGGGAVVNIGSVAAKSGNVGQGAYASSKAGLEALTRVTAREGAPHGVRANAIRPGLIRTDMTAAMSEDWWNAKLDTIPLGRPGEPDEVAAAALFLASDLASYITGSVLDVTGGREMSHQTRSPGSVPEPARVLPAAHDPVDGVVGSA